MSDAFVSYRTTDGVALVRIDPADSTTFLAQLHPMHRQLRDVFGELAGDDDVRAVVIRGGDDQFCPPPALHDLRELLRHAPAVPSVLQDEAHSIVANILAFPKPLVAAVAAPATGFGAQVALLADFLVTHPAAVFQDAHVRIGLAAGDGGTLVWPLAVGLSRARHHVLRGHPMSGADAQEFGLVEELVDLPEQVVPAALRLAAKLAALPARAYADTKAGLNGWLTSVFPTVFDPVNRAEVESYRDPAFRRLIGDIDG